MTQSFTDVLSPQARIDPVAYFAKLREEAPVFYSDPPGMWLVTRYDDAVDLVRRPEDFSPIAMRLQAPAMKNGDRRMHGGKSPGAPKGNRNALKHGHYTAEAIAWRREIGALLRGARELIDI